MGWRRVFPLLEESEHRVVARFFVLRRLTVWVDERMLPFCDLGSIAMVHFGRIVTAARSYLLPQLKHEKFNEIVRDTSTCQEMGLNLDRMRSVDCRASGEMDELGSKMLFGQAARQTESVSKEVLRSSGQPFKIDFTNEDGIDQGGPYRDFLDRCAEDVCSHHLPLFIPTQNQRSNAGEDRDAWHLSPKQLTQATRRMYTFLGNLIGICVRRGDVLPLVLSRVTWQLLVGTAPDLQDLACEDNATATSLQNFMNVEALGATPEDFEDFFGDMRFVFHNSAGIEVPLVKRGGQKRVTFANAREFAELVLKMRLNEASEAVSCIRLGMSMVIPIGYLSLWTWQDLELRVCGNPYIDVATLKKHATLDGYQEGDNPVKYLWYALENFSQEDLSNFVRFCWGRSRLPPEGSSQWENGFKITRGSDISEEGLPRAHTCFFQIDLPLYPNKHVAHDKILFAVQNCTTMSNS